MTLVERLTAILLKPKRTWLQVEAERATVTDIFGGHIVTIAGVAALRSFIGMSLLRTGGFGVSSRMPIVGALVAAVAGFVVPLAGICGLALIIDRFAPKVSATQN